MTTREFLVSKIDNGTVIDHIPSGQGLRVLNLLGLDLTKYETAVALINIPSKKLGTKDILKIKNRELTSQEVNKIALIAQTSTLTIIRSWEVVEKRKIEIPGVFSGVATCPNSNCVSNSPEPISTRFVVEKKRVLNSQDWSIKLRCHFCERAFTRDEITDFVI